MSSRNINIFIRVFIFMIVGILLFINNKKSKKIQAKLKQFTFADFEVFFEKLLTHKLENHYMGIASNEENCIYFTTNKNKINIEYEALTKKQVKFAEKLMQYAKSKNFEIVKTTYQNKMIDNNKVDASVVQILSKLNINNATSISKEIFTSIFNCDVTTKFDMVS